MTRIRTRSITWLISIIVTVLLAIAIGRALAGPQPAPEVTFTLTDGRALARSSFEGRVLIVDFWATTCPICIAEMPDLVAMADRLRSRGLAFVAVAMPYDRPDHVMAYLKRTNLPLNVAIDVQSKVTDKFGPIVGTPTLFLIDRQGRIADKFVGAVSKARLEQRVLELLAQPANDAVAG